MPKPGYNCRVQTPWLCLGMQRGMLHSICLLRGPHCILYPARHTLHAKTECESNVQRTACRVPRVVCTGL
jgi:hypothetical protein